MHADELQTLLPEMSSSGEGEEENQAQKMPAKLSLTLVSLTGLAAVGGFLFGYDTGVVSGAMLLIEDDPSINPTTVWKELIVSVTVGFALLFSLVAGPASERFGRKPIILAASVVFTVGAVVMSIAGNKEVLLAGRAVVGAGVGLASATVPVYISESAPSGSRGALVTCNQIAITFGQFVASCVCGAFADVRPHGWKYMLGLAGIPSALQFAGFAFMPESPRWLASKNRLEEAAAAMRRIGGGDPNAQLREIRDSQRSDPAGSWRVFVDVLRTPSTRRALALGCLLQVFQQLAGINTVMYYSAKIITMAGFSDQSQAIWISAGVSSVNFLCSFLGLYLVERAGRRRLVLASLAGVTASLLLLAVGFQVTAFDSPAVVFDSNTTCSWHADCTGCTSDPGCGFCFLQTSSGDGSCDPVSAGDPDRAEAGSRCSSSSEGGFTFASDYCPSDLAWLVVLGLCLYLFCFAPGMGPMPWTVNSEIYPTWARSLCNALATSTNWMFNLVVSMTFLSLTEAITKQGTFYLYTGIALLGYVVFYFKLPETKGVSLEETETLFGGGGRR